MSIGIRELKEELCKDFTTMKLAIDETPQYDGLTT